MWQLLKQEVFANQMTTRIPAVTKKATAAHRRTGRGKGGIGTGTVPVAHLLVSFTNIPDYYQIR